MSDMGMAALLFRRDFAKQAHWAQDAKGGIAFLEFRRFRLRGVHEIKQILIAGNNQLGIGCEREVHIVCIVGVSLIRKDFGNIGQKRSGDFDGLEVLLYSLRDEPKLGDDFWATCYLSQFFNNSRRDYEIHFPIDGQLDALAGRPLCRSQCLKECVAIKDDSRSGGHSACFLRRSARMACFSASRKSESSSSATPLRA